MLTTERNGKYFVWSKGGHRPRYSHKTHKSAYKEACRLARKYPGRRFIVQKFHEKVFVDTERDAVSCPNDGGNMQKKYWAGVQSGHIRFFDNDPTGNVENIEAVSEFTVNNDGQLIGNNDEPLVTSLQTQQTPSQQATQA